MLEYAYVLNFAIPFFITLMAIEALVAKAKGKEFVNSMDTISSLSSGFTNVIKDVLGLVIKIVVYAWLVDKIALFSIPFTWLSVVIAFLYIDFVGYWVHRLEHSVNYFWNRHIVHHSSEEYNLACALRQSISQFTTITTFLLIPMALVGVPYQVYLIVAPIHLFMQFWYHTRLIGKMGFLEKIIVTPSHHRVHHAINDKYMDKNFAQIFIFWDRMFGTFQEELDNEPPIYGVRRQPKTWNPVLINFQHLALIVKDCWRTKSWKDKFLVWFKPTGWRPADVAEKYPIDYIKDVYSQQKYMPEASNYLKAWSWFQLVATFSLMVFLFNQLEPIGQPWIYVYGLFLILGVFSYTTLMDKSKHAWWIEIVRAAIGLAIINLYGAWFTIDNFLPFGTTLVAAYFVVSAIASILFDIIEIRKSNSKQASYS
jgi:alkylglycerol monooxygenase